MNTEPVQVHKNARGAWSVYVRGNFISDHATHTAARIVAQQVARAEANESGGCPHCGAPIAPVVTACPSCGRRL